MILEEGGLVRVQGQGRRVYRVTRIRFTGEFDCTDDRGMTRTFKSEDALPHVIGDVAPARSGTAAPARRRGTR